MLMREKDALGRAFLSLRKQGYIARQNHLCCGSCSAAKIASDVKKMPEERRAKIAGVAHFDRQRGDSDCIAIMHGPVSIDDKDYGKNEYVVGAEILRALCAEGLDARWNGDPSECVLVYLHGSRKPETGQPWQVPWLLSLA